MYVPTEHHKAHDSLGKAMISRHTLYIADPLMPLLWTELELPVCHNLRVMTRVINYTLTRTEKLDHNRCADAAHYHMYALYTGSVVCLSGTSGDRPKKSH